MVFLLNVVVDIFGRKAKGTEMDMTKPKPVRRLDASTKLRSAAPAGDPDSGHHPLANQEPGPGQPVGRRAIERRPLGPTIDRMRIEDVSIDYGQKRAVRSVTLPIRQGEVLALIGPSGCGKTTLLRSLNRLTELTPFSPPERPDSRSTARTSLSSSRPRCAAG